MLVLLSSMLFLLSGVSGEHDCSPDTLYPQTYPKVSLSHPSDPVLEIVTVDQHCFSIAVIKPDNSYFVLYDPGRDIDFSSQAIRQKGVFSFPATDIKVTKASEWPYIQEPLFTIAGQYQFYFAENLETETNNTLNFTVIVDWPLKK